MESLASDKSELDKRRFLIVAFVAGVFLNALLLLLAQVVGDTWLAQNLPLHASIEMGGSVIGLMVAYLLLRLNKIDQGCSFNYVIASALLAMGFLDGLHAAMPPGKTFIWLHSSATAFGGALFVMVWLPAASPRSFLRHLPGLALAAAILFGALSLAFAERLPEMLVDGQFSMMALALNIGGGLAMLAAAIKLYASYRRDRRAADLLFCMQCVFLGAAAIMFEQSSLWDISWWGWHLMRFLAYVLALWLIVQTANAVEQGTQQMNQLLEHRVAERTSELEKSTARMDLATEGSGIGIWEIDVGFTILTNNDMMYTLYGITREQCGDNHLWIDRVHPDDRAAVRQSVAQAMAGEREFDTSFRILWPSGEIRWIHAIALVQRDVGGKPLGMIGTNWDITGIKLAEQAKTEFVSTVSHELRTPLTSISGALGLVMGDALGEVPPKMSPILEIAYKNSRRLTHLINDLLDIEKLAAGKFSFDLQVLPLMPLIEECLVSTQSYAEQYKVNFVIEQRADDVQVRVDGNRIQQVIANFLSNAAKFSPAGAQVTINIIQRGQVVRVEVIDCGAGIPQEFRNRIFQKFSQADSSDTRQKGGTGLGLAISKELIERMNGLVGFHSELGQGACFHFELPIWQAGAQTENTAVPAAANDEAPRLLVVEDEPDIASLLATILGNAGYRVDVAPNAATASRLLAIHHYAAVCLDLMLPDRCGLSVVREIRSTPKTATLPVVIVSAYNEDGKLAIAGQFNALDWIEKPFDQKHLLAAIGGAVLRSPASETDAKPRVLHIEDDADFVSVFGALCQELADIDHADNLAEARRLLARQTYQAIVLDLNLPDGNGMELLPDLKVLTPPPAVIVLSGTEPPEAARQHIHMAMTKSEDSTQALLEILAKLVDP